MSNEDYLQCKGTVVQALGNAKFKVLLDELDKEIVCDISGKIRRHTIRIIEGDKVMVDIPKIDPTKGKITYRSKKR